MKTIRRATLARLLRRRRVATELRKKKLPKSRSALTAMSDSLIKSRFGASVEKGRDTKARRAMDALLADMERNAKKPRRDDKEYAPIVPLKKEEARARVIVEDCKVPCEECLLVVAMIYSGTLKKQLCLNCEAKLMVDIGAMAFDRLAKKKRGL